MSGRKYSHVVCQAQISEQQAYESSQSSEANGHGRVCDRHFDCNIFGSPCKITGQEYPPKITLDVQLLRVCRQVYAEVNPPLWLSTTWSFGLASDFEQFMRNRNTSQRNSIRKLLLQINGNYDHFERRQGTWRDAMRTQTQTSPAPLANFPNLEVLHIDVQNKAVWTPDDFFKLLYLQPLPLKNVTVFYDNIKICETFPSRKATRTELIEMAGNLRTKLLDNSPQENHNEVERSSDDED